MSDHKLVLHPINPRAILQDPPALLETLRQHGLIGAGFSHVGELHYKTGTRFRELIAFKASPPAPATEAGPAWHVSLLETTPAPVFLGASNAQPPACPNCQQPLVDWRTQLVAWQSSKEPYLWACARCKQKAGVERLGWGKTAGIARYSLDVWGIAEDQAVPTRELVDLLQAETFETWRYFYYRF
jgi:hypothetical protein